MSDTTKVRKKKRKHSTFIDVWRRLKKNKIAFISLFIILFIILVAIFADVLAPYPYDLQDYSASYAKPGMEHLLGADKLGRDTLSRLIYGARQSLQLGFIAIAISTVIGILIGSIAGYYGGKVDLLIMRFLDIYQSIPMLLLCIVLSAMMGPSLQNAILAIGIAMIPLPARMMRAAILTVREQEYIEAAKAINTNSRSIIIKHIIPNAVAPLIVSTTMSIGMNILAGAALSFIGLGVQPPVPEWGSLISEARNVMREHSELALYPGLCIMITVLAFNLLGDGLRDALDPRLKN